MSETAAEPAVARCERIAVLVHERDAELSASRYLLRAVVEAWRAEGRAVHVLRGVRQFVPADAVVVHLDRTVVPDAYLEFARRYPVVVNEVRDIGKRAFSAHLVTPGDGTTGPVIVKTERNSGGLPELAQFGRRGVVAAWAAAALRRLPRRWTGLVRSATYPVFDAPEAVPPWVYRDRRFVVQRFLPERHGALCGLRRWTFLGDRAYHTLALSKASVVKGGALGERTHLGAPPAELIDVRRRFGFDFGKFDYGVVDGKVVLYDVNRTPSGARVGPSELAELGRFLAPGIDWAVACRSARAAGARP